MRSVPGTARDPTMGSRIQSSPGPATGFGASSRSSKEARCEDTTWVQAPAARSMRAAATVYGLVPVDSPRGGGSGRACRVAVVADRGLVAETVRTALVGRGHAVVAARLPETWSQVRQLAQQEGLRDADVGLLLVDLDVPLRRGAAVRLLDASEVPWVVLADTADDAARGAVVRAGALGVLPMSIGLAEVDDLLRRLRRGDPMPLVSGGVPRSLIDEADRRRWLAARDREDREQRTARLEQLTPREHEVLDALHRGRRVDQIGVELGMGVGTVRTHVRAILRKLGVRSQLAAVVVYRRALERDGGGPEGRRARPPQ